MAMEVCGKKVQMGNRVETRGKAKYLEEVPKNYWHYTPEICS